MIKLIAFDMDGTLTDSRKLIVTNVGKTLAHFGGAPLEAEQILSCVGFGAKNLLERTLAAAGAPVTADEAYPYYDALYAEISPELVTPYPGVKELLRELGARGVHRVLLSNRPHRQTVNVVQSALPGLLDEVYGQREGVPMKPDPTALLQIMRENRCKPEECVYVGDMHYDTLLARNAGVRGVGCLWGLGGAGELTEADLVIERPEEILAIIS